MTSEPNQERVIDVWGYVQRLWAVKWTWLVIFVLVMLIGGAYALTRPTPQNVSQSLSVIVPTVATEAEATQQAAVMGAITSSFQVMALRPPVTDAVFAKHPEIKSLAALRTEVSVVAARPGLRRSDRRSASRLLTRSVNAKDRTVTVRRWSVGA